MGTERLMLVLQIARKGPLSFPPRAGGQMTTVMTISPGGVSKRISGRANPKEAQSICGIHTICHTFCHTLIILLAPHPYDVDLNSIPILQISELRAWRRHA